MWIEAFNLVIERLGDTAIHIIQIIPMLISAGIIFCAGWIIAGFLRFLVLKILKLIKFEARLTRIGVLKTLSRQEINPSELIGNITYWLFILMTLVLVIDVLGINLGQLILHKAFDIIPNIIVAALILIFGSLISLAVEKIAYIVMINSSTSHRLITAKALKWTTLIVVIIISLEQLGLAAQFVLTFFQLTVGAIALALAISFGLGCKDIARDIIIEFFKNEGR